MVAQSSSGGGGGFQSASRAESAPPTRGRAADHLDEGSKYMNMKPAAAPRHSSAGTRSSHPRIPTRPNATSGKRPAVPNVSKLTTHKIRGRRITTMRRSPRPTMHVQPRRYSMAMSRTESVLAASSGDVVVCRCRRSSLPYLPQQDLSSTTAWYNLIPCCDGDFMNISQADRAWSPFDSDNRRTNNVQDDNGSQLYEWDDPDDDYVVVRQGLLGGAMHKPIPKVNGHRQFQHNHNHFSQPHTRVRSGGSDQSSGSTQPVMEPSDENKGKKDPTPEEEEEDGYDVGLLPLPSFDYSHIRAGHNDMVPLAHELSRTRISRTSKRTEPASFRPIPEHQVSSPTNSHGNNGRSLNQQAEDYVPTTPEMIHGVPSFLPSLSQIRISKVSAHPQGAHVLMISSEALLFAFGLNNHGQLGIGIKSDVKSSDRGFVKTPTIITPLLENGGKAINCAAGMNHSLVVVQTEGRRLQKLNSRRSILSRSETGSLHQRRTCSLAGFDGTNDDDANGGSGSPRESVQHHQLYGFGSNSFMKIGLVSAICMDPDSDGDDIGAHDLDGVEDVLLPRRVALHCSVWPKRSHHDYRLPPEGIFDIAASREHSAALVRRATGDIEVYTWGNATLGALGVPFDDENAMDSDSSNGDSFSRSKIIPIPDKIESLSYHPNGGGQGEYPTCLSLGPRSTFVTLSSGKCMSCGYSEEGMLGQGEGKTHSITPKEVRLPTSSGSSKKEKIISVSAGAHHVLALTSTGNVYSWGAKSNGRLGIPERRSSVAHPPGGAPPPNELAKMIEWTPSRIEIRTKAQPYSVISNTRAIGICAGYDSSLIVAESGEVLSFGKRSGRIGQGDVPKDVSAPQPLYGGFRLFHQRQVQRTKEPPPERARSVSATRRVADV